MEDKMFRQLTWIKWLLIGIVAAFVFFNVTSSWYMWTKLLSTDSSRGDCAAAQTEGNFQEQGKVLLQQGKEQEVLALAASREKNFPKDPYVFLYRGRAQFQLREYEKAIEAFNAAEVLSPDWRDQYIAPYVTEAKRLLSIRTASRDASGKNEPPPPTATEIYERQVNKALEQQQRLDQLLATQEEQAKRFGAILDRWEQQTGLKKP